MRGAPSWHMSAGPLAVRASKAASGSDDSGGQHELRMVWDAGRTLLLGRAPKARPGLPYACKQEGKVSNNDQFRKPCRAQGSAIRGDEHLSPAVASPPGRGLNPGLI